MSKKLNEYTTWPKNPSDGDMYRDEGGIQWIYISEVSSWALDLTDADTNHRYHAIDHLPSGKPIKDISDIKDNDIVGYENVMRALDENK